MKIRRVDPKLFEKPTDQKNKQELKNKESEQKESENTRQTYMSRSVTLNPGSISVSTNSHIGLSITHMTQNGSVQPYDRTMDLFIGDTFPKLNVLIKRIKSTQSELDRRVKEEVSSSFKIVQSAKYALREALTGEKPKSLTRLINQQENDFYRMIDVCGSFVNFSRSEAFNLGSYELQLIDDQSRIHEQADYCSRSLPLLEKRKNDLFKQMNDAKGTPEYFELRKEYVLAKNDYRNASHDSTECNVKGSSLVASESYVSNTRDTLLGITEHQELILIGVEQACQTISHTKRAYELVFLGTKSIAELVEGVGVLGTQVSSLDQHMIACSDYLSNLRNR